MALKPTRRDLSALEQTRELIGAKRMLSEGVQQGVDRISGLWRNGSHARTDTSVGTMTCWSRSIRLGAAPVMDTPDDGSKWRQQFIATSAHPCSCRNRWSPIEKAHVGRINEELAPLIQTAAIVIHRA